MQSLSWKARHEKVSTQTYSEILASNIKCPPPTLRGPGSTYQANLSTFLSWSESAPVPVVALNYRGKSIWVRLALWMGQDWLWPVAAPLMPFFWGWQGNESVFLLAAWPHPWRESCDWGRREKIEKSRLTPHLCSKQLQIKGNPGEVERKQWKMFPLKQSTHALTP